MNLSPSLSLSIILSLHPSQLIFSQKSSIRCLSRELAVTKMRNGDTVTYLHTGIGIQFYDANMFILPFIYINK